MDLCIEQQHGWDELEDFTEALDEAPASWEIRELWRASGRGDYAKAVELLEDLGFEFDSTVKAVLILSEPDDIIGDLYRVWVSYADV